MRIYNFYGICLIAFFFSYSHAQDTVERERALFLKNVDLYRTGRFEKAEENFALIVKRLSDSPFITANHLMLIKTYYKLGQYNEAIDLARDFFEKYPKSSYTDDVFCTVGDSYYQLDRYETAVQTWLNAINHSDDQRLIQILGELVTKTVRYRLLRSDLTNLREANNSAHTHVLLALADAETKMEHGGIIEAQNEAGSVLAKYPDTPFRNRLEELLKSGSVQEADNFRIALLLPFTGPNGDIGQELREGVEMAAAQFNNGNSISVQLVLMDYGQDMTKALHIYKELAQNKSIIAAFGPLENDISAALAALSEYERLPLFSPTASEDGITDLTDYFFQLNSPLGIRIDKLVQYTLDSLAAKRFSTFAPADNIFIRMSDQFTEKMRRAGAQLASQEWYYPGDQDFNKQFMQLKRVGLKYAFRDSLILESPEMDTTAIDSLYHSYQISENKRLEETNTKIDSADIPVYSIDAVFIPIYKEDIQYVAPQIAYSNIRAQFIGNGDWYDPEQLKKNKNYINGILFISDGFLDEENWDFKNFRNIFRERYKKTPTLYNLVGYDSFRYMLRGLNNGPVFSREQYKDNIEKISKFEGIYRTIQINQDHYNTNIRLLKYDYGQIIPLQ